jgi:hypothetical protein
MRSNEAGWESVMQAEDVAEQVLAPGDPRWQDFVDRLEGPEGCDFKDGAGDLTWRCGGDKTFSVAIMRAMGLGEEEINATVAYFEQNGGYCDCEVLLNMDRTTTQANDLRGMFHGNEDGLATAFQEASRDCSIERDEQSVTLRFECKWSADVMGDYLEGWLQSCDGGLTEHVADLGKAEFASLLGHYLEVTRDLTPDQEEAIGTAIAVMRGLGG